MKIKDLLPFNAKVKKDEYMPAKLPDEMFQVDFRRAAFCNMDLRGKIFKECDLRGADFRWCNLEDAQFIRCDIRGTNFGEANMTNVKMPGSVYNTKVAQTPEEQEKRDKKTRQLLGWNIRDE